ncbi:MAG: class I SAM-dependent methyltransferase [Saprospiraceae bacterium]|nr:class I SAM-dependent methyltransferase [Saprospiraceae bacterium]
MNKEEIRNWYNVFAKKQTVTGTNLRHFTIINNLIKSGLKKNHLVLEIGCGIGTLTGLIQKYLSDGKIVATDISDESIRIAKEFIPTTKNNIEFIVTDMKDFRHDYKFDFIVLPDVLEHIPIEQHTSLFRTIAEHMHEKSKILINIPHPKALDYIRNKHPESLQIIDQSISAKQLLLDAYDSDLILIDYISYAIFNEEDDYATITFKKNRSIILTPLSRSSIILKKLKAKIKFSVKRI